MPSFAQLMSADFYTDLDERHVQHECRIFENWHFQNGNFRYTRSDTLYPSDGRLTTASGSSSLEDWLDMQGNFALPRDPEGSPPSGGLRVLLSECPLDRVTALSQFANFSPQNLRLVLEKLCVPDEVKLSMFAERQTSELAPSCDRKGRIFTMRAVCTPVVDAYVSLDLVHDFETHITTALVIQDSAEMWEDLWDRLKLVDSEVMHPLLLPVALLQTQYISFRGIIGNSDDQFMRLRRNLGVEDTYVKQRDGTEEMTLLELHSRVLLVQDWAYAPVYDFLNKWSDDISKSFDVVAAECPDIARERVSLHRSYLRIKERLSAMDAQRKALIGYSAMAQGSIFALTQERDNNLNREIAIDQRRVAEAAKRDSSSMKTIAAVTMVFLPGTAVATIFSMNPFFVTDARGKLSIQDDFYWYWVVTIPLTALVIGAWMLWMWITQKIHLQEMAIMEAQRSSTKSDGARIAHADTVSLQRPPRIMSFEARAGLRRRWAEKLKNAVLFRQRAPEINTPVEEAFVVEDSKVQ